MNPYSLTCFFTCYSSRVKRFPVLTIIAYQSFAHPSPFIPPRNCQQAFRLFLHQKDNILPKKHTFQFEKQYMQRKQRKSAASDDNRRCECQATKRFAIDFTLKMQTAAKKSRSIKLLIKIILTPTLLKRPGTSWPTDFL